MGPSLRAKTVPVVLFLLLAATPGSLAGQLISDDSLPIHRRKGIWFNVGLGTAVANGIGGQSANLALGWSLNPRFLVAVGSSDWRAPVDQATVTVGTLDLRMQFYPELDRGFFLTGGLGLGYCWMSDSGSGPNIGGALLVGLGFDARIGENVSITTFINAAGIHTPDPRVHVGQIGVGLTFH
jgi:hypothetical protein